MGTVELTGLEMMFKIACVTQDSNGNADHPVGEIHPGQAHLGTQQMCQPKGHVMLLHCHGMCLLMHMIDYLFNSEVTTYIYRACAAFDSKHINALCSQAEIPSIDSRWVHPLRWPQSMF